jgi:hypothetical protein
VVVQVLSRRPPKQRCGRGGVLAPGYDQGEDRRRWRPIGIGENEELAVALPGPLHSVSAP